jgi:hypothetical protein
LRWACLIARKRLKENPMQAQKLVGATGCLSAVTLAAGATTTIANTGTIQYAIKGKAYSLAAMTATAAPTADIVTGAAFIGVKKGYGSLFVYGLNAAGDLKCAQGGVVPLNIAGASYVWGDAVPSFPELPDNFCPIGYLTILAGSTADATTGWIQGTNNQASVTGITYARQDVGLGMPDRPKTT